MKVLLLKDGRLVAYNERTAKIIQHTLIEGIQLLTEEGQSIFLSQIDSVLDDNCKRIPILDAILNNYFYSKTEPKKPWWKFW